ncbi:MAG: hypothetical protein J1F67_06655 [Muribaculaceae bacterium]|nr:hypothetical protein [Muribaculaceae bacterium]
MPLIAHLQFGDNDLKVYNRDYMVKDVIIRFKKDYDEFRPVSDPRCESIELTVYSPGKTDTNLQQWYINDMVENGRIIMGEADPANGAVTDWKQIFFSNAHCFSLGEHYSIDSMRRALTLKFTAEEIEIQEIEFKLNS